MDIMAKPQSASLGQIRIIGGKWRGRKLPVRDSEGLRPTTDRIKETLFNWLMPIIREARCLDCFAGSGSLGFEALSRFADSVTFIELDKQNAQLLTENKARLQSDNANIINGNSLEILGQNGTPFDVVFIDPPFRKGLLSDTIQLLEKTNGWQMKAGYMLSQRRSHHLLTSPLIGNCIVRKFRQVAYRLFIRHSIEENSHAS